MTTTASLYQYLHQFPGFRAVEDTVLPTVKRALSLINESCGDYEGWQIILGTVVIVLVIQWAYDFIYSGIGGYAKVKKSAFSLIKRIPYVRGQIEAEIAKTAHSMQETFDEELLPGMDFLRKLPEDSCSVTEVCKLAANYQKMGHFDVYSGRASGAVYHGGKELTELNSKIYEMFAWTNPLHSDLFPDVRKMEAEVVRMCLSMFNGGPESCGTMTNGGTESIMLACKAYRDRAIDRGIRNPEILAPRSAHAAFEKACQTYGMQLRTVAPDPDTMAVDVRKMKKMINKNTCMLVCSCPDFPAGVIDPVEQVSQLGLRYDIPVHVDCCLGGFLVPFMEKAGYPLPLFDFRLPGVTSISCDTHKYGFAPKGSSVVMYRNKQLRRYQFFVITDWPGGIYATPTIAGSRPGAIIAACWATMVYFGEKGYVESTRKIIETARYIRQRLSEIEGIYVLGKPLVSVISIGSLDFDVYRLSSALTDKGWSLNVLQFPFSFHLCCTLLHTQPGVADQFVADVAECTAKIMLDPGQKATGMAAIYGMSQTIPDRSLVKELVMEYLDAMYNTARPSKHKMVNGSK